VLSDGSLIVSVGDIVLHPVEVVALMEAAKVNLQKPISTRNWKPQDWIDHASFGVGRVSESRGDKLDIDFVNGGRRTLLKSTELNRAVAPSEGFKFPRSKGKPRIGQLKVKSPPKRSLNEREPVSHA
jgi:hypothetical protein